MARERTLELDQFVEALLSAEGHLNFPQALKHVRSAHRISAATSSRYVAELVEAASERRWRQQRGTDSTLDRLMSVASAYRSRKPPPSNEELEPAGLVMDLDSGFWSLLRTTIETAVAVRGRGGIPTWLDRHSRRQFMEGEWPALYAAAIDACEDLRCDIEGTAPDGVLEDPRLWSLVPPYVDDDFFARLLSRLGWRSTYAASGPANHVDPDLAKVVAMDIRESIEAERGVALPAFELDLEVEYQRARERLGEHLDPAKLARRDNELEAGLEYWVRLGARRVRVATGTPHRTLAEEVGPAANAEGPQGVWSRLRVEDRWEGLDRVDFPTASGCLVVRVERDPHVPNSRGEIVLAV